MTFTEWQRRAQSARERAQRVAGMLIDRANAAARAAGLGPERNVWTNAMLAYDDGAPWREVHYPALRRALWLDARSFVPGRIYDEWHARTYRAVMFAERARREGRNA